MYPAILSSLVFVVLTACLHHYTTIEKKIFTHIALLFSLMSATILVIDYFIQISVIQASIINRETEVLRYLVNIIHTEFLQLLKENSEFL